MTKELSALALGPRGLERPQDAGWALTGVLGGTTPARVDRGGLVTPAGAAWSVDWWIGAGDRWYLPSREPTARQRRLGPGPVLETTMRVPSGNARHTAYGALVGGREVTVVEVTNDSSEPVALALAIRPYPVDGGVDGAADRGRSPAGPSTPVRTAAQKLSLQHGRMLLRRGGPGRSGDTGDKPFRLDGRVVLRGDDPLIVLPRPPADAGASPTDDLLEAVITGGQLTWSESDSGASANAVMVVPLPHRASLRLVILPPAPAVGAGGGGVTIDPASAPGPDEVVNGWRSVIDAAAGFQFPDPGLTQLMDGARARLLLAAPELGRNLARLAPGSGVVLAGLAVGGHRSEVRAAIGELGSAFPSRLDTDPRDAAEIVAALAPAAAVAVAASAGHSTVVPPWLLETGVTLTQLIERSGDRQATSVAMTGLARLSSLAGDDDGAAHLAHLAAMLGPDTGTDTGTSSATRAHSVDDVNVLAAAASPVGTWDVDGDQDDPVAAARFVLAARSLLVDDAGADLVVLRDVSSQWRGGGAEVAKAPTVHGRLSYAIRWHGYRPALLWHLEPGDGGTAGRVVVMRCPGLDPDWVAAEPRGEALLQGTSNGLQSPPAEGESFA